LRQTLLDKVKTNMRCAVMPPLFCRALLCKIDCALRHLRFRQSAPSGQRFDGMPITIATGEIHVRVDVRRIRAQDLLDQTERLNEFLPIGRT